MNGFRMVLVWAALLGACGGKQPAASEPAAAAEHSNGSEQAGGDASLAGHMRANFRLALDVRDAVVGGNLELAQQKARDLAWQDYKKVLPENWMGGVDKMQLAARQVAEAKDVVEAAQHVAELAATCGDCHARLEGSKDEPEQDHGFSAKGPDDLQTRMARHERAADGMWFGLSMPSDPAWRGGARALTEAPLSAPEVEGKPVSAEVDAKMEAVRDLGRRALEAEQQPERVKVYGELLGKCAGCHTPT